MSRPVEYDFRQFKLPARIVTKIEVSRLVSEVEAVDNSLTSIAAHEKVGSSNYTQPAVSKGLEEFLAQNDISLEDSSSRSRLIQELRKLKDNLPVVHITFATQPDRDTLQQMVTWLRNSVDNSAVIAVGLQPSLVAGVYVRTPNRVFDFSLRGILRSSHDSLVKHLEAVSGRS